MNRMSEEKIIAELEKMMKLDNEGTPCLKTDKAIIIKRTTAENIIRILKIKDEYMRLARDLLYDYDGYYNKETKKGDIEALTELIDEAVGYLELALKCDDRKDIYANGVDGNKRFNILLEEIKEDSK